MKREKIEHELKEVISVVLSMFDEQGLSAGEGFFVISSIMQALGVTCNMSKVEFKNALQKIVDSYRTIDEILEDAND